MAYNHTQIGKISTEMLANNISVIKSKIDAGLTTVEKEISWRLHEVNTIRSMTTKSDKVKHNNKIRVAYIEAEIQILNMLKR
jgi:hypothetical protein